MIFSSLKESVTIFRDGYSIPHIFSKSEYDLFFAQGFVTAQDRLWQMDIFRRTAKGELSEIFGPKTLATDSLMRLIGIARFARKWQSFLSDSSRRILQAYTDGVNAWRNRMPIETRFLGYKISPWTIEDCLCVYLLFAFQNNLWWIAEPFFMATSNRETKDHVFFSYLNLLTRSLEQPFLGMASMGMICAVGSSKTETGKPLLLAFLPWTRISIPANWYEIYLSSPQIHVRGFSIPGFPFVWSGFNGNLAWVAMPSGEKDLHLSTVSPEKKWTSHTEWISVKDKEKCAFDFFICDEKSVFVTSPHGDSMGLQLDWAGLSPMDVPFGFYRLIQAKNPSAFQKAVEMIPIPATMWVYGDTSGKVHGLLFQKGKCLTFSTKEILIAMDFRMGNLNSRIVTAEDLSTLFRIERILDLCKEKNSLSGMDLKAIASDQISLLALQFLRLALPQIASLLDNDPLSSKILDLLSRWKGEMNPGSNVPLVVETWMHELISELFRNSMEQPVFSLFSKIPLLPYQSLIEWLENPPVDSENVKTILLQSFRKALHTIQNQWGEDPLSWNWANAHTLTLQHPLDEHPLLKRILDAGPFPLGGSCHTLSGWLHDFDSPFRIASGHAVRMLIDFKNPDHSVSILATGQSGQVLDVHYKDQLPLFLKNCYHPSLWDSVKITQSGWKALILKPGDPYESQ